MAEVSPPARDRLPPLPPAWRALKPETRAATFRRLVAFLAEDARTHVIYPPAVDVFRALELTPPDRVRVLVLGQDPYAGAGQAHGLCFSVRPDVTPPPSLRNIFRELASDIGVPPPSHGCLTSWARQGVLLLNAVLTVRAGDANSHRRRGWEPFTDAIIRFVSRQHRPVVSCCGAPTRRRSCR
jgi:uracil-DNA glycosylase